MKFQKHLIVIPTEDNGTANVTATIAMGTALAYVQNDNGGYVIIAMNLGNQSISNGCVCKDERHAQLFIAELRKIIDWTQSGPMIMSLMAKFAFGPGAIEGRVERAFTDAKTKHAKEVAA